MNKSVIIAVIALFVLLASARRRVSEVDELIISKRVTELQWKYNRLVDTTAARGTQFPHTDPVYQAELAELINVFCPDPEFQGWTATTPPNSGIALFGRTRDTGSPGASALSVAFIYDLLAGTIFVNSSQHHIAMPITVPYIGDDGRTYCLLNATIQQWDISNSASAGGPRMGMNSGHYSNTYVLFTPPGGDEDDAYWCMREFHANTLFSFNLVATAVIDYSGQVANGVFN